MSRERAELKIDPNKHARVLLLGNGLLKLGNKGQSWEKLLQEIQTKTIKEDISSVPYAMQPEILAGTNVEKIQKAVADKIDTVEHTDFLLSSILELPFDAVLTTNYTYEIEECLSGKRWTEYARKKYAVALDGNTRASSNVFFCNLVNTTDGRRVPVFHIHGEKSRSRSLILSYYSYADSVARLISYNRDKLENKLLKYQTENNELMCGCWLDYFIAADVWSVGFGLDISEFDVWWAIERKAREKAKHGRFTAFLEESKSRVQKPLLEAMGAECVSFKVEDNVYGPYYEQIIEQIKSEFWRKA